MTEFDLKRVIGTKQARTKIYQKSGPQSEFPYWYEAIVELYGDMVSPGGAHHFCPISRAAVHKRLKDGSLTGFFFYPETPKRNFFGKTSTTKESPYGFIPVSELKALTKEMEDRAIRKGYVTEEELEGDKPDWYGDFLEWNSKFNKEQRKQKE